MARGREGRERRWLIVTRLETGCSHLDLATHKASSILRDTIARTYLSAVDAGVGLDSTLRRDFNVRCAFEPVVQVLVDLTSNALRVTPPGCSVEVRVECIGSQAQFAVIDEGPAIPDAHLGRVFDRGWRRTDGHGPGLSIIRGIVEAHGGALGVRSEVGRGATFQFTIPLQGPPERAS